MSVPNIFLTILFSLIVAVGLILSIMVIVGFSTFRSVMGRQKKVVDIKKYPYLAQLGDKYQEYADFTLNKMEQNSSIPNEEYIIEAKDGAKLKGYFFKSKNESNITIICSHGFYSSCFRDFAGILPFLLAQNYNVLFTVSRAHVGSEGKYITCGKKESQDLLLWAELIDKKIPNSSIFVYGISLGAVNAMVMTALDGLPSSIKGVIEDSGYTRTWDLLFYQIRHAYRLSPYPTIPIANHFAKNFGRASFKSPSAIESVKHSSLPILFIHGNSDILVPTYMGEACYKACSAPKKLVQIDDSYHFQNYYTNPEYYEESFLEFVNTYK